MRNKISSGPKHRNMHFKYLTPTKLIHHEKLCNHHSFTKHDKLYSMSVLTSSFAMFPRKIEEVSNYTLIMMAKIDSVTRIENCG